MGVDSRNRPFAPEFSPEWPTGRSWSIDIRVPDVTGLNVEMLYM